MSANAVNWWVQSLLDGTVSVDFGPAQVYVAPPQADALTQPTISIWGTKDHEERRTFPRGTAYRKVEWDVYLYIKAQFQAGHPRESAAFPLFLDAVKQVLRDAPMSGQYIRDPDTLQQSQIISIGEDFRTDYPGPRDINPQGFRMYEALIIAMVAEDMIG